MLASFPPLSAARRKRYAAAAVVALVAAVVGMGQPAMAAPSPSPSASAPAQAGAVDKTGKTGKASKAGKAVDRKKAKKDAKPADPKAAKAGKATPSPSASAKPGKATTKQAVPTRTPTPTTTPSPTPAPSKSLAPTTAATPSAAATAQSAAVEGTAGIAVTGVQELNGEIDVTVTWTYSSTYGYQDFEYFVAKTNTGGYQCQTTPGDLLATSCTMQNVAAGQYTFTVDALYTESTDIHSVGYPHQVVAPEPDKPKLTAAFDDASIKDHAQTAIVLTMTRKDTSADAEGLGYTVTLPDGLVVADADTLLYCAGDVTVSVGSPTITLSGATIVATNDDCGLRVAVTSPKSGAYPVDNTRVSGLAGGLTKDLTTQTLTVTSATPTLDVTISPKTIPAKTSADIRIYLMRTDENESSEQVGIGYQLTLPNNVTVAAGTPTNTCKGTVSATPGGGTISLGNVTLTGPSYCYLQVPVTSQLGGTYPVSNGNISDTGYVTPHIPACEEAAEPGIASKSCGPTLTVTKLAQAITFTPAASVPLATGTMTLSATADSELTVAFTATPSGVCTVSGTTLTVVGAGTCKVTAAQAGNGTYNAATPVVRDIAVVPPAPAAPTLAAGVSSLTASWPKPQNTNGITGYRVSASPGQATCETKTANDTSCVLGGTAGTVYTVTVVALVDGGASAASPVSNQATPTAPQPPATPPDTDLTLTTDQGIITQADPGEEIVFIGTGFAPFSTVVITIYSAPTVLGTTVTNSFGNFSKPITVPRNLAAGAHTAVAQGVAPDGSPRSMKLAIKVVKTSASGSGLALTGAPIALILLVGLALLGAGAGLTVMARTRRRVA